ncbi:MAG: hypothetical protein JJU20_06930 [Opitutales bacterium]|nr:hypothetical protein [Opitutales bacterium]
MPEPKSSIVKEGLNPSATELDASGHCVEALKILEENNDRSNLYWSLCFRLGKDSALTALDPEGDFQKSIHFWLTGKRSQAVTLVTRLVARQSEEVLFALQLALYLRARNMISATKVRFENIYQQFPDYKPGSFYFAETTLLTGNAQKALQLFESCPQEVVECFEYYWRMGKAHLALSNECEALEWFARGAAANSSCSGFWMDYAKLVFPNQGPEAFRTVLEKGDSQCGKTKEFSRQAASLCRTLECDELWEHYLAILLERGEAPDRVLPDWIYACSKLFNKGQRPEKMAQAQRLASNLPLDESSNPEVHYALANVLFFYNRIQEGLKAMEAGHSKDQEAWRRQGGYLFYSLYDQDLSPEELFARNRAAGAAMEAQVETGPVLPVSDLNGRPLRVGWVSPDLRTHPVGYFLDAVVGHFPDGSIESFFYDNYDAGDLLAKRFSSRSGWRNIKGMPDVDVANRIREDKIDILVDLAGHTTGNRLTVFACKPAPVQVSWLGYPSSTGLKRMDYRISDADVEPPGSADELSSEIIWRMPRGFHAFRPPFEYPDVTPLPALKEGVVTFGCYNNLHKINEDVLAVWAGLLNALPGSRLLLKHENLAIPENRVWVAKVFQENGVDLSRIHFKGRMADVQKHVAAYSWVDIALDPFPYNGTTTNCDALYMGVPVIGLEGDRHASRVTASFMRRLGLEDWVAATVEDYIRIGVEKASDLQALAALRQNLRQRFIESPLGDPEVFAKVLAEAFHSIWQDAKQRNLDVGAVVPTARDEV